MSVFGTEVLPNPRFPADGEPPLLLHPNHVARLAGETGAFDTVVQEIARQKLRTYEAWGRDNLLSPADAERVVKVMKARRAEYDRQHVARLDFEQWKRDELERKRREAHAAYLERVRKAKTEEQKRQAEALRPPPPFLGPGEQEFKRFLKARERETQR
jgi:hypothetical protein